MALLSPRSVPWRESLCLVSWGGVGLGGEMDGAGPGVGGSAERHARGCAGGSGGGPGCDQARGATMGCWRGRWTGGGPQWLGGFFGGHGWGASGTLDLAFQRGGAAVIRVSCEGGWGGGGGWRGLGRVGAVGVRTSSRG